MIIYGIKTCDSCKKALKALPEAQFQDIRAEPLTRDQLALFLSEFGDALLNTRSTTWRGLDEAARMAAPIDLLLSHPTLMKRPVITDGTRMTLGWSKETQAQWGH